MFELMTVLPQPPGEAGLQVCAVLPGIQPFTSCPSSASAAPRSSFSLCELCTSEVTGHLSLCDPGHAVLSHSAGSGFGSVQTSVKKCKRQKHLSKDQVFRGCFSRLHSDERVMSMRHSRESLLPTRPAVKCVSPFALKHPSRAGNGLVKTGRILHWTCGC